MDAGLTLFMIGSRGVAAESVRTGQPNEVGQVRRI
jgi:hypothetical protein